MLASCTHDPEAKRKPLAEDVAGHVVQTHRAAPSLGRPDKAVPAAAAGRAEPGEWRIPLRDHAGTRYSELTGITRENVSQLRPAWRWDTGLVRGHEAPPLVVGSTMFLVLPFPNDLVAFDLERSGTVAWRYSPAPDAAAQGAACCDVVNRGAAFADGRIHYATLDGHAIAVDAATGDALWKTRIADIQIGETITMAPLVVRDLVFYGNSGSEFGVRGWVKALRAATGQEVWRAYSTGPDADVLIGETFRPFYADHRGADLGKRTWPGSAWKIGGGSVWGWLSYDPELDLLYYGTANAAPWNPQQRSGDNKWAATIFARRPDTGEAVWAYQWDPQNRYGWDGVSESVLLDMPWNGAVRRVMVRAERNGYVYVIDRATGEVLAADAFVHANAHTGVDLTTGRPHVDLTKSPRHDRTVHDICPSAAGARGAAPAAFSARTGLLYIPVTNLCADVQGVDANYVAGTPYVGARVKMYAGPGGHKGELLAWDPVRRERVWSVPQRFPVASGPLATAGDVVFYGTLDGRFHALDAWTGELLWEFETDTGIIAPPVTYRGPDGRQYVAIFAGPGGWVGSIVSVPLDSRDSTAARGMVNAMRELPRYTGRGGALYVFALP